jgi:hypothetical protein
MTLITVVKILENFYLSIMLHANKAECLSLENFNVPQVIFTGKAWSESNRGTPERCSTEVGSGITCKY